MFWNSYHSNDKTLSRSQPSALQTCFEPFGCQSKFRTRHLCDTFQQNILFLMWNSSKPQNGARKATPLDTQHGSMARAIHEAQVTPYSVKQSRIKQYDNTVPYNTCGVAVAVRAMTGTSGKVVLMRPSFE